MIILVCFRLVINHFTLQVKDAPVRPPAQPSAIDPKLDQPNHKLKKYGEKVEKDSPSSNSKVEIQSVRIGHTESYQ